MIERARERAVLQRFLDGGDQRASDRAQSARVSPLSFAIASMSSVSSRDASRVGDWTAAEPTRRRRHPPPGAQPLSLIAAIGTLRPLRSNGADLHVGHETRFRSAVVPRSQGPRHRVRRGRGLETQRLSRFRARLAISPLLLPRWRPPKRKAAVTYPLGGRRKAAVTYPLGGRRKAAVTYPLGGRSTRRISRTPAAGSGQPVGHVRERANRPGSWPTAATPVASRFSTARPVPAVSAASCSSPRAPPSAVEGWSPPSRRSTAPARASTSGSVWTAWSTSAAAGASARRGRWWGRR